MVKVTPFERVTAYLKSKSEQSNNENGKGKGKGKGNGKSRSVANAEPAYELTFINIPIDSEIMKLIIEHLKVNHAITKITFLKTRINDSVAFLLSEHLKTNTTLIVLCLQQNLIGNIGAALLCNTLEKYNKTIQYFDISHNHFNSIVGPRINSLILNTTTLKSLNIGGSLLSNTDAIQFGKSIPQNKSLISFYINKCKLTELGVHSILEGLVSNPKITNFDILDQPSLKMTYDILKVLARKWRHTPGYSHVSCHSFDKDSIKYLLFALNNNRSITSVNVSNLNSFENIIKIIRFLHRCQHSVDTLDMSSNVQFFGDVAAREIAELLKQTVIISGGIIVNKPTNLIKLDIRFNNIGNMGLKAIADALKTNTYLESLDLRNNIFNDIEPLCEALEVNTKLTNIELTSQPVTGLPGNDVKLARINSYIARNIVLRGNVFWCRRDHTDFKGDCHKMIMTSMLSNDKINRGIPYDIMNYIFSFWQYKQFA
uniref:Uncharacterized protein n=1 Tax=viral metagenome TaxID=1070528 RepID=A0A6C0EXI9_9ZZZZ